MTKTVTEKNYYLSTPIYYVNDKPHIGHAYTSLACDVMARFMRMEGYSVYFLTGTDEHGQKIEQSARNKGLEPQAFTDQLAQSFRALNQAMNFSNDDFIRTTETRHKQAVQHLWLKLQESGMIYQGAYEGWYAVSDEAFYAEDETEVRQNGKRYARESGKEVEWVKEPSYFFRLSAFQGPLLQHYENHPDFILPLTRRNEVVKFVEGGLKDLSISRTSFKWGIQVPGDENHIMYVWLDALANYITALGYSKDDDALFQKYWPAQLHMVGKDILRFHAVYWPAFLMAAKIPLPKRVFAHGWWTNEGQKISKSLGNVIDPLALIEQYGLEQTRYFLMREVPFGNDGDFAASAMVQRINSDLANAYGNLVQRVLSLVYKNCQGKLPTLGVLIKQDQKLIKCSNDTLEIVREHIARQAFNRALEAIWHLISEANIYVDETAPWALAKSDIARMQTVLTVLTNIIRRITLLNHPFMPQVTSKILETLGEGSGPFDLQNYDSYLPAGIEIAKPTGFFPRYEEKKDAP